MPTILEDYISKHQGSAQRYDEASNLFPGGTRRSSIFAAASIMRSLRRATLSNA